MKKKICFVVQRYGLEVNGGAELHCRQLAEHMLPYAEVHVATSKAIDYMTWKDEYPEDTEDINGVMVHRFGVVHERDIDYFNQLPSAAKGMNLTEEEEQKWIDEQGPLLPELIDYLKNSKDEYDCFIFFTYLYYQTVMGVKEVKEKAIVIPTAHDEPFLRMKKYQSVFKDPRAILFNTDEERVMIRKKFQNWNVKYHIGGVGVELPSEISKERFYKKYNLKNYMIYVGRIDEGKNCHQLFKDFIKYKEKYPSELKLVLMGKEIISVPKREDIVSLGFVDDQDKFDGIAGADFLVLPSRFESLSMVVLEAFSLNIPVLVNGECEVLAAHCRKSNGGFYYKNTSEFCEMVKFLESDSKLREQMGMLGQKYVKKNYQWDVIVRKLVYLIDYVEKCNREEGTAK